MTAFNWRAFLLLASMMLLLSIGCHGEALSTKSGKGADAGSQANVLVSPPQARGVPKTDIRFSEMTTSSGINFTYQNDQDAGIASIVESLGGGVAIIDFDLDDLDDVCSAGGGRFAANQTLEGLSSGLFRNLGDWTFASATLPARLESPSHYSHGVIGADYDSDGYRDLLITGYGGLQLWRNQGDGTFQDATLASDLKDRLWSTSAGWGDLNGDGTLDLYVAHYVDWSFENHPRCTGPSPIDREVCPPRSFSPLPDIVYFGNGDGTFRDASEYCGLRKDGKGLGVLVCDLDLDGDLDVYVANDTVENFLYENKGEGRFADVSVSSATAFNDHGGPDGSMGVDAFDFNLDGQLDLWVTNYENENCALYQNLGQMFFRHVSKSVGVTAVGGMFVSWGTCCFDIDCDGDEDIFVSNGHVIRFPTNAPLHQRPLVFENLRATRFVNIADQVGRYFDSPHMGRGTATADFDNDGALDLVVSHINEPMSLLKNESNHSNHWLEIELVGIRGSRDAIGATVHVTTSNGQQIRQWHGGGSYASTNSRRLHFGLGMSSEVLRVEIRWPSGSRQIVTHPAVNQKLRIVESLGS